MSGNANIWRIISVGYANIGDKVGFIVWCPGKNMSRDVVICIAHPKCGIVDPVAKF
jgi:hypothetical protein